MHQNSNSDLHLLPEIQNDLQLSLKAEISTKKIENLQQIPQNSESNPSKNDKNAIIEQNYECLVQKNSIQEQSSPKLNQQNQFDFSNRVQSSCKNMSPSNNEKISSCHCKKSKCLKLYCDCFARGNKCRQTCKCLNCANTKEPNPFKKPDSQNQEELQKSSDSNKKSLKLKEKSCNCKRSFCLKKYCQCYNAQTPCGQHCKCEDCKNNGQHINFRDEKMQGNNLLYQEISLYHALSSKQNLQGGSQQPKITQKKQQINDKRRQKLDEDEIQTKISQILKLVPEQNYQTMLDFLAYCLS